jgi:hypothetical protein
MKLSILAGSTSQSVNVFIQDSSSTTGAGKTGLVYTGITAYYTFAGANATATSITMATLATVTTAYASGGFIEISSANMPGVYRFDLPNAVLAASKGRSVLVYLTATGAAPCPLEIELTGWDNQDGVRAGLTALPNVAAGASGGLPTGNSSGQVTFANTSIATVTTLTNLPSIPANWLTATGIAASALNGKGDWLLSSSYTAPPSSTTIAGAVWDVTLSGHVTSGTTGNALNAAGAAGDPWSTAIPGSYGAGTAGNIVGNNLNATVSSRLASASISLSGGAVTVGTNNDKTGYSLTQAFPTNFSSLSIDSGGNVATTSNIKKNTAKSGFMFVMTDSTTHAPKTGLTVAATRSIDGGAFSSCTNSATEVATGTYVINLSATDTNGDHIMLRFTGTGADDLNIEIVTQP